MLHVPYFKSGIGFKRYQFSNLNKILSLPSSEGTDFKSDIYFWKVQAQILKFEHFCTKKYKLFNLNKILPVRYFKGADLKPDIRFLWFLAGYTNSVPRLCKPIQCLSFGTYLGNAFFVSKSQNTMASIVIFLKLLNTKYDI